MSSDATYMVFSAHAQHSRHVSSNQTLHKPVTFDICPLQDDKRPMLCCAGLEQEVRLLMTVVQQVQAVIDACQPHLQWAHQAQQLQQKLQGLQAAVASAEAGAGRSVVTCATSNFNWSGPSLHQVVRTCWLGLVAFVCVLLVGCKAMAALFALAMKPSIWSLFPSPCQKSLLHPALGSGQASKHKS